MTTAILDLETSSFYADSGIILCACIKPHGPNRKVTTIRADRFPSWKTGKTKEKAVIQAICKEISKYDIIVAHNGQWFDKGYLNAKCIEFGLPPILRSMKLVDPVLLSRRHLRLGRNSLNALIAYLKVPTTKTPIELAEWRKASHDSNIESMNKIVYHCVRDVISLDEVYTKVKVLAETVDKNGSAR